MSLNFTIIPIDPRCEEYANEIKSAINQVITSNVFIDNDYNASLSKKLIKHKKNGNDIITITSDNAINKELTVRYADNGSRPEFLTLDIFIELIKSYYDEETKDENEKANNGSKECSSNVDIKNNIENEDTEEGKQGGCNVM